MSVGMVAVILGVGTALVAVTGRVIIKILKTLRESPSPDDRRAMAEETRLLEEMAGGLAKMERRIEALETILLDRQGKDQR